MEPSPLRSEARVLSRRAQIAGLVVLAALAGVALLLVPLLRSELGAREEVKAEQPALAPGHFRPTEAQWATLKFGAVQRLTFRPERITDGKIAIDDDRTTPVFSPYSGRVTRLFAKAGDRVDKGAPLLALEASEFVQGQNDLIAAVAALNTARSQLKLAVINERRQHELFDAKAGALKDWQQAQTDLESAKNTARSAEIALAAVRNRLHILGKSDREIDDLETAKKMDPQAIVAAPIGGTVIQRQVGLGQYINSTAAGASTPVFSIGDLSVVWLVANVRETDAPLMHVGAPVDVRVLAYPGRVFKAKLTYVAPAIDANTHRLPVRAEVENADGALKPEMFASFSIMTGDAVAAPAVPQESVIYEGDVAHVWVAHDDKSLSLRQIHTGRTDADGMVEVLAGLQPGEKVVTSGSLFIDRAAQGD
ncbi:MAG TPA: efflux RND transporter periplasmic adaptor subunit [Stellaceae bacterium]|nr:efflux RND transporter periplasmic adaptor subunit [Stellaceae bacterium]